MNRAMELCQNKNIRGNLIEKSLRNQVPTRHFVFLDWWLFNPTSFLQVLKQRETVLESSNGVVSKPD